LGPIGGPHIFWGHVVFQPRAGVKKAASIFLKGGGCNKKGGASPILNTPGFLGRAIFGVLKKHALAG